MTELLPQLLERLRAGAERRERRHGLVHTALNRGDVHVVVARDGLRPETVGLVVVECDTAEKADNHYVGH